MADIWRTHHFFLGSVLAPYASGLLREKGLVHFRIGRFIGLCSSDRTLFLLLWYNCLLIELLLFNRLLDVRLLNYRLLYDRLLNVRLLNDRLLNGLLFYLLRLWYYFDNFFRHFWFFRLLLLRLLLFFGRWWVLGDFPRLRSPFLILLVLHIALLHLIKLDDWVDVAPG